MGTVESFPQPRSGLYSRPVPIMAGHKVAEFECGRPPLNDFLKQRALKNEGRASRTFVVSSQAEDGERVVGFYSLAAGAVQIEELPGALKRNMPNPAPVMVLGRMGVDQAHAGRGLGKGMLQDALRRCIQAHQQIGAIAVVVHAIDADAVTFYSQFGFQEFPTGTRTMFLPMKTVIDTLA